MACMECLEQGSSCRGSFRATPLMRWRTKRSLKILHPLQCLLGTCLLGTRGFFNLLYWFVLLLHAPIYQGKLLGRAEARTETSLDICTLA